MKELLVEVKDLKKYFPLKEGIFGRVYGYVRSVDGVSLNIERGETLALVGESGCGKTTFGRLLLRLIEPTFGRIIFNGVDITKLKEKEFRPVRRRMQIVFQDPLSSLNPRMKVKDILGEPFRLQGGFSNREIEERVLALLEIAGLREEHMYRYPHELSGGQRQRVCILRAIALNPEFLVLDEPTSALDVSVQAQILNFLKDLQRELGLTYLFITHDLGVVRFMSDRAAIMYLGRIVEIACNDDLFNDPIHPYTRSLLSAIPVPDPDAKKRGEPILGEVPSPTHIPSGCRFHPRCPYAFEICFKKEPELEERGNGHFVACHLEKIANDFNSSFKGSSLS
ncbi:MAG: ABC transporter ATP-binding protein [Synergistetes bacterium]|nr:MAG: Oligopeptide ABC transporter ATP-binding protein [bacterium 42_11]MBC7332011.1 ABC transporter ATP-binding protein [Synergistota bacterium]MDK2871791.1 peptide/nickel transport system ATP-binding protein [bacterium]